MQAHECEQCGHRESLPVAASYFCDNCGKKITGTCYTQSVSKLQESTNPMGNEIWTEQLSLPRHLCATCAASANIIGDNPGV